MNANGNPKVQDFMTKTPHCIDSAVDLKEASQTMRDLDIRHLPVRSGKRLIGILSARNVTAALASSLGDKLSVSDVLIPNPYIVERDTDLAEVVGEMANEKYGSAIVTDEGQVIGIFTTVDACLALQQILEK